MDDAALVRRLMGLPVPVATAKRIFPGTPPGLFFEAAPFDGRGRALPLRSAFAIALRHAEEAAREARQACAAAARAADLEEARAAAAAPALDYTARVIEEELSTLADSLRARSASPRAIETLSLIEGRCARQIARARARISQKGAHHVPA